MKYRDAQKIKVGDTVHVSARDPVDTMKTYERFVAGIATMNLPVGGEKLIFATVDPWGDRYHYVDHLDLPNFANKTGAFSSVGQSKNK